MNARDGRPVSDRSGCEARTGGGRHLCMGARMIGERTCWAHRPRRWLCPGCGASTTRGGECCGMNEGVARVMAACRGLTQYPSDPYRPRSGPPHTTAPVLTGALHR